MGLSPPSACQRPVIATLSLAVALLAVPQAHAATISPSTFADDNSNNGNCTLREAIIAANTDVADDACTAGTGADRIALKAGRYELSVPGSDEEDAAMGDLDVTDTDGLEIIGARAGSAIDANAIDRIFHTRAAANASFVRLTITGGNVIDDMGGAFDVAEGSTATITDTTLIGNTATGEGGAIEVHNLGSTLNLTNSTVVGNASTGAIAGDGGGMEYDGNTLVNVTNTTFSGNAAAQSGGAIESEGGIGNFLNVTVTNNSAPTAGGIVLSDNDGAVNLKGTILAGNRATGGTAPECSTLTATPITSQGHNLIGDASGCAITSQPTDLIGRNPRLRQLADNGGPTRTHALAPGSPAIDAGPTDAPTTDQRGVPRSPDIGAYEFARCAQVVVNRVGTAGADRLRGTNGADGFLLLAGADRARALGGNDALCGGKGRDRLRGGKGRDRLKGGPGADKLNGGPGGDRCNGGPGRDRGRSCERDGKIP